MAVRVVIYDSVIQAHFTPGGIVYRNGSKLGSRAQGLAKSFVHSRSGFLKSTITHGIRPGRLNTFVNLKAAAPYAPFVEHGTTGPIVPTSAPAMPIPPHGRYRAFLATEVSGQSAQRFLQRGMNRALNGLGYGNIPGEY